MSSFSQAISAARDGADDGNAAPAGKLLIVDDLADNREILTRRFVRRGFEIVEASCGDEALRLLREHTFDVVLLDMMMPGMDGAEVLAHIRGEYSAEILPVIMVTAKSQSEDVVGALKLGANDYVTKPVDFAVALARVNNQIGRRRAELEHLRTQETLQAAKVQLERRVSERGVKLLRANATIQDEVSRRVASESKITYLAHHDTLTGLPNRFTFDNKLDEACQFAREIGSQLSLLFVDLDGFKNVNDTIGHSVGDELLKEVAALLTEVIGAEDFCARFGGDEFAIVHMSEDAKSTAADLAQRVISTIGACHDVAGHQVFIGASVGISVLEGNCDAESLLKQADLAMYRAKADGRGVFRFFEVDMGRQVIVRRNLEVDLRRAVANGEFQLYYQPLVDLKTRSVSGVEALMRWNHAERGFVSPTDFIPIAEETGLIVPMGEWALRQACSDAAQWPTQMRVAVNLSPIQFRNMNLITAVVNALSSSGLAADRLELEITENVVLSNNPRNLLILTRLRELGVRIALDDFGTGYSGLGYLRSFQFDKVKIDGSFIREMKSHPESLAIIQAAIGLGDSLGFCTTAEGVETLDQLEGLQNEGCTEVQGFWFSRPQANINLADAVKNIAAMQAPETKMLSKLTDLEGDVAAPLSP